MNVDREDELRIQAPPGAASASESWLQLDGTGMMPEAQERKRKTTAHTNSLKRNLKEKILRRRSAARGRSAAGKSSGVKRKREPCCEGSATWPAKKPLPAGSQQSRSRAALWEMPKCLVQKVPAFQRARRVPAAPTFTGRELTPESRRGSVR